MREIQGEASRVCLHGRSDLAGVDRGVKQAGRVCVMSGGAKMSRPLSDMTEEISSVFEDIDSVFMIPGSSEEFKPVCS